MKKILKIKDRNRTIYFRNRKVRTPCTIEVTDKEIENLRLTLKMTDIQKYSVQTVEDKEDIPTTYLGDEEVVIEELDFESDEVISDEKPKTILEKLMNGDKE
jgi:hypothetical protein